MDMDDVYKEMIDSGFLKKKQITGCSGAEIEQLKADLHVDLPADYQQFLRLMGHEMGNVFMGEDAAYGDLRRLQDEGRGAARDNGFSLPAGAFVFLGHQGYRYYYLQPGGEVYVFDEGDKEPEEISKRFTDFLYQWFKEAKEIDDSMP